MCAACVSPRRTSCCSPTTSRGSTPSSRAALNRERANVGRSAYSDRLKDILLASSSPAVAGALADDLAAFETGEQRAESGWVDVALHAAKILNASEAVVFVTTTDLSEQAAMVEYARDDGLRVIPVPKNVAKKLVGAVDVNGDPLRTLKVFARQRAESFVFDFVDAADLTDAERALLDYAADVFRIAEREPVPVLVSETMRPAATGADDLGLWDPNAGHIVLRRDQLASPHDFFATLLHEIAHSLHNEDDVTFGLRTHAVRSPRPLRHRGDRPDRWRVTCGYDRSRR